MGITDDLVLQTAASYIHDCTSIAINPNNVTPATQREGGFILRNRIDFGDASTAGVNSSASQLMATSAVYSTTNVRVNQIYVLDVPKRTLVKHIKLFAVEGEDAPTVAYRHATAAASASSSSNNAHTLQFSSKGYKSTSQSSFASVNAGQFGELDVGQMGTTTSTIDQTDLNGGKPTAVSASSTSAPESTMVRITVAGANGAQGSATYDNETYFPFGGKVFMNVAGTSAWEATSHVANNFSGHAQGVWELQADCNYVPE